MKRFGKLGLFLLGFLCGTIIVAGISFYLYCSLFSYPAERMKYLDADEHEMLIAKAVYDSMNEQKMREHESWSEDYKQLKDPKDKDSVEQLSKYFDAELLRKCFYIRYRPKKEYFVFSSLADFFSDFGNIIMVGPVNSNKFPLSPQITQPFSSEKFESNLLDFHQCYNTSTEKKYFPDDSGNFYIISSDGKFASWLSAIVPAGNTYFVIRIYAGPDKKEAIDQLKLIYFNRVQNKNI